MSEVQVKEVNEADLQDLKSRMKLIADADPTQYHNDFSLKRYLRAFKTVDDAFKVKQWNVVCVCVWLSFVLGNIKNEQVAGRVWCSGADTGNTLHKIEFRNEKGAGFET